VRWKKPSWVQNVQKAADNAVKPITTAAPVKAVQKAAEKVVQAVTPPPMPKPPVLQKIQTVAQKAADNVGQGLKDAAKDTGAALQKAGDAVGDVVRPAAQSIAKEAGYVVNPILGEIKYRADNAGKNETIQRIGDKLKGAVNQPQANAGGNDNFEFLPFFTKKLPDAAGDVIGGVGRTAAGILTGNSGKIESGLKRTGSGVVDAAKHTGLGTLEVLGRGFGRGPSDKPMPNSGATTEKEATESDRKRGIAPPEVEKQVEQQIEADPSSLPKGVKVASNGTLETTDGKGFSQTVGDKLEAAVQAAIRAGKIVDRAIIEPIVNAFIEGTDKMDTKIFRFKFEATGQATPEEVKQYRKAVEAGDTVTMKAIEARAQQRKATK
jgi:hypothetical protein